MKVSHLSFWILFLIGMIGLSCNQVDKQEETPNLENTIALENIDSLPAWTGTIADTTRIHWIFKQISQLYNDRKFEEGLTYTQNTLDTICALFGEQDTFVAKAYNSLSNGYFFLDQARLAEESAQKALDIMKGYQLKPDLISPSSYIQLAKAKFLDRNYTAALSITQQVLNMLEEKQSTKYRKLLGDAYNARAMIFKSLREYDLAILNYQEVINLQSKGGINAQNKIIGNLMNIGIIHYLKQEYDEAIEIYTQALEKAQTSTEKDQTVIGSIYGNMGIAYESKGNYEKAIELNQNALGVFLKLFGPSHPYLAIGYNNLGIVYRKKGAYSKALSNYEKALAIRKKAFGDIHPKVASLYGNMGVVFYEMANYKKALEYQEKALDINLKTLGDLDPRVANNYGNIGTNYNLFQEFETSEEYFEKALEIQLNLFGEMHLSSAKSLINLGHNCIYSGKLDKGITYTKKAIEVYKQILGENHPDLVRPLNNLGILFRKKGQLDKAMQCFERASRIIHYDIKNHDSFSKVTDIYHLRYLIFELQNLYSLKYNLTEDPIFSDSLYYFSQTSIKLEEFIQKEYLLSSTRQFYAADAVPIYEYTIGIIMDRNKTKELPQTFILSEKTKGRQLAEKIQSAPYTASFGIPDSLRKKENQLGVDIAFYERKVFDEQYEVYETNDSLLAIYKDKLFKLNNQKSNLLEFYKNNYPEYYNIRFSQQVVDIAKVQSELLNTHHQALVEYFVGDSSMFTFVILPDDFHIIETSLDFPLYNWVQNFRCHLLAEQDEQETCEAESNYPALAYELYQTLFEPLEQWLPEQADILIVPDGALGYLPFEALLTSPVDETDQSLPYLVKKYSFSYAYSATLQLEMQQKKHQQPANKNLLAIAPEFKGPTTKTKAILANRAIDTTNRKYLLTALKHNIPEAKAVSELFKGDALVDETATKKAFLQKAKNYRILHLSTHGKANDQYGDFSFLAFQTDNPDSIQIDKEWLYNQELYNMQLNADMVVLSACETGIGELQRGEGIISLARGFSYAGAKSLVTSLWNVNDRSTKELMEGFYSYLAKGIPKHKALRQAKLDYIDSHPFQQSPYYWAAFIPIGDMEPIELANGWNRWWLIGGLSMVLIFWLIAKRKSN